MSERNIIAAACDLARSGRYRGISSIERALKAEGYTHGQIEEHFFGRSARRMVRDLCRVANADESRRDPLEVQD